jgi:hypothetical protein
MIDRREVIREAREKLGATGRMATGEYTMLARLLEPGEEIRAMVIARPQDMWIFGGVFLVATNRRLLIVAKRVVTRRERVEDIHLERIRGARMESPVRIVLDVQGTERTFSFASPPPQVAELLAWANGDTRPSRFEELDELARRKLGKMIGFGSEPQVLVLDAMLESDEAVLDLASSTKPDMLVAVCPTRVILVPTQGLRKVDPATVLDYARLRAVTAEEDDLVLDAGEEPLRLDGLLPIGAAGVIAGRIAARLDGAGPAS